MKYTGCFSRNQIQSFCPPANSVLISIVDPDQPWPKFYHPKCKWVDVLRLKFWDVTKEIQGYSPPMRDDVEKIWDFIKKYEDNNIFAHCEAGISRSGAIRHWLVSKGWESVNSHEICPNSLILDWFKFFERGGEEYKWPMAGE